MTEEEVIDIKDLLRREILKKFEVIVVCNHHQVIVTLKYDGEVVDSDDSEGTCCSRCSNKVY